jgi:hypothetical protein
MYYVNVYSGTLFSQKKEGMLTYATWIILEDSRSTEDIMPTEISQTQRDEH